MNTTTRFSAGLFVFVLATANLFAGGSGLNVVVIANQNSSNSLQLANYYCEKRGVPPQNVLRINWTGGAVTWTRADLDSFIRTPLNAMLTSRQISNQIDFVLLSMDIPYRVTNTTTSVNNNFNSTTATLYYGFKNNIADPIMFCTVANASASAYAGSEGIFRATPPWSATSNSWLTMMLTCSNLAQTKAIVDRGVQSDGTFPTETAYVAKSFDVYRNIRYLQVDNAIFNTRLHGDYSLKATNTYTSFGLGTMLGFQNGLQSFTVYGDFAPGAMADNLTSFSGFLLEVSGHTDALDFLIAGATASYGTITEPCAYFEKFPSPQNYFYQSRGFSIAESYYQSITNPYQGILVGEPLAAPFALPSSGAWNNLPAGAVLAGTTNLSVQFEAADSGHPIQQMDLFVNGTLAQTLTNLPPRQNNILHLFINGFPTNYTVPANATVASVASNLTLRLNGNAFSNATRVAAFTRGDRIELQGLDYTVPGSSISLATSNDVGSAAFLAAFLTSARSDFLDSAASGFRNFVVTNAPVLNAFVLLTVTKTNGTVVSVGATNDSGSSDISVLLQALVDAVNTNATLIGPDGVMADDLVSYVPFGQPVAEFNVRARTPGWPAAQIQTLLTASAPLQVLTAGTKQLEESVGDLRPRNHIYVTAGLTNLAITFPFNTTTNADGFHELTAVAYEGSHVRTQKRVSQTVRITNSPLAATFTCLLCDTNTALESTLQFQVAANTNTISRIEFFSTGGSWGVVSNSPTAAFYVGGTNLGLGLHPFYAIVMRTDGKQYRTEMKWIRLIADDVPFTVSIVNGAPTLIWPATAGRRYEVLSATNVMDAFTLRDAVVPTNSPAIWAETNNSASQRIYRVRTAP